MNWEKQKQLAKAAYLYYVAEKKQAEIAKELNVDRTTVSRMLTQAKKSGLIEIKLNQFDPELFALEAKVKQRFGLEKVELAPSEPMISEAQKELNLAQTAESWLRRQVKDGQVIGVAWGASLGQMIEQLEPKQLRNIIAVPIVGGPSHIRSQFHVNTLVYELAKKFQGTSIFINAMVVQENQALAAGIVQSKYFHELKNYWQHLDIALVGIGGPLSYQKSQWRDLLTETDLEELKLQAAVADCCCRFLNRDGKVLNSSLTKRTIGVSLTELAQVPQRVAVARGIKKAGSILAVLNSQAINTLITDQETAEKILALAD